MAKFWPQILEWYRKAFNTQGKAFDRSISAALGAISFSENLFTEAKNSFCVAEREKTEYGFHLAKEYNLLIIVIQIYCFKKLESTLKSVRRI